MAGESARESARRQREKAERLQKSAELWERGADGEQATAAALDALPKESWTVFHDVRWPGRKFANVDHVAVGPTGVFVIDSKNWSGSITVSRDVLRQNGRSREKTVNGAAEAALAVAGLTPVVVPQHVHPVLCFVRDEPLTGWARDVMICSTPNLVELMVTRPEVLPPHILLEARLQLDAMVQSASAPRTSGPQAKQSSSRKRASRAITARPPASPSRSRRRRKNHGADLIKLIVALGVAIALITSPQLLTSFSQGVAGLLTAPLVNEADSGAKGHAASGRRERAVVVRHVDGDTLVLKAIGNGSEVISREETKVRLLEIDTPESVKPGYPVECYALRASGELKELAPVGSTVRVLPDRDLLDPYGRTLLYLWNDKGDFVNLELVRSGAAEAVLYEPNDRYIGQLRQAERKARADRRGRWGAC